MITTQIMKKIEDGEIASRRNLYSIVGRSKKLMQFLNANRILMPNRWSKERVKQELFSLEAMLGRIPKAQDDWRLTKRAQQYYGGWNSALEDVFGLVNQRRYGYLTDEYMLSLIRQHVIKNQRLPLREEFNGNTMDYPYWGSYVKRFDLKRWSDIYKIVDLSGVKYYHSKKHGFGEVSIINGIVYLSRQERLIGEYLTKNEIQFEKEKPYGPNCDYVFDFYLPKYDLYVEYYGIATAKYKERIERKRQHYGARQVLEIFKHDNTIKKLDSKVQRL